MVILDNARSFIVCDKNETQEETGENRVEISIFFKVLYEFTMFSPGCDPVWIEEMKGSKEHAEALVCS